MYRRLPSARCTLFFWASSALLSKLVCFDTLGYYFFAGEVATAGALASRAIVLNRPTHVGEGRPRRWSNDCGTPSV
jgi:hypothetical protein